ncbi:DNA repair protein RecN [bacterium]|nr:DNA repair protein RecN [bacterium]
MLQSLRIKNLATIENLELNFEKGFSILTGETGAGKSIIIDGLRLVLGAKGSSDTVRTGKKEMMVEAVFHPAQNLDNLQDFISEEENEFFIHRKIPLKNSAKGYINGILVPMKKLREIRNEFVDIYGQNDHIFLRKTENQLDYLDEYAEAFSLRTQVSQAAQRFRSLLKEKNRLENKERDREQRLDFLDFQINEIEKAQLEPDEEEKLNKERNILKNMQHIRTSVEEALEISYNQENSVSSLLSRLQSLVKGLNPYDEEFKEMSENISQFSISLREFVDFLIHFKEKQTASPEKLESIEERLNLIDKLKRKYGNSVQEILSYLEGAKKEFEELSRSREKLSELNKQVQEAFTEYKEKAEQLSQTRKEKARTLEKQMEEEMKFLGMKKARFQIDIHSYAPEFNNSEKCKDSGTDEVEFLISPNPGEDPKPLRKIVSGGELSRIMLALKSIGKDTDILKTLIFDEIDAGIGGETAEVVARKLKNLSRQHQVICITHLPQIASFAHNHYKIQKRITKERTFTTVKKLNFEERIQEIALLLAGSHITDSTLKNAREMLEHNLSSD